MGARKKRLVRENRIEMVIFPLTEKSPFLLTLLLYLLSAKHSFAYMAQVTRPALEIKCCIKSQMRQPFWLSHLFFEVNMKEFKNFHPIVNFIYFVMSIGFAMVFMNPIMLGIAFFCSFLYVVVLKGRKGLLIALSFLPFALLMAAVNPLFNHRGVTIITYFSNGNPITLESILFGASSGVMIITVILYFSCYNKIMTSDKFIYLFGKISPSMSLIFSMTLRFVPRFSDRLKELIKGQKSMGKDIKKLKTLTLILSAMTSWALESSIETADSMKARGYGLKGRSTFSIYTFEKRDFITLFAIILLSFYVISGSVFGATKFVYYPYIKGAEITLYSLSVYAAYFVLSVLPVFIEISEVIRWNALKSKI